MIESRLIGGQIGYIRLYSFGSQAPEQFKQALDDLKEQGMKGLIIDLRGNPGGLLDAAVSIGQQFIDKGTVVTVKNRKGKTQSYSVDGPKWQMPLAVLVDGGTASAAEIVTAALKDYQLATVIGTTTFGKGVVQNLIQLENGGVLKLTVEEYFTPSGKSINKVGIQPDIIEKDPAGQLPKALDWISRQLSLKAAGPAAGGGFLLKPISYFSRDGETYVPLAPLNEKWAKGKLGWQKDTQMIKWQAFNKKLEYAIGQQKAVIVVDGRAYITLGELRKQFPEFVFTLDRALTIEKLNTRNH
jgi:carboxyl-terminal processing protease